MNSDSRLPEEAPGTVPETQTAAGAPAPEEQAAALAAPLKTEKKRVSSKPQFSEEDERMYKAKMRSILVNAVLLVLLAVYLLNANQILFAFTKGPTDLVPLSHRLEEFPASAVTHAEVENLTYLGGLKRQVRFYGWAFAESPSTLSPVEKQTRLVLTGPSGSYEADCVVSIRPDIYYAQSEQVGVPSSSVGFEAIFSTLPLRNGTYAVQLYCQENGDVMGLSAPVLQVRVQSDNVYDADAASVENLSNVQPADTLQMGLDQVAFDTANPSLVKLTGWALDLENTESAAETYLEIRNKKGKLATYPVERTLPREDLIEGFGLDAETLTAGFVKTCLLPRNFGDIFQINAVFVQDGQARSCAQPYTYVSEAAVPVEKQPSQAPVENFADVHPTKDTAFVIDVFTHAEDDPELYTISGWALYKNGAQTDLPAYFAVTSRDGRTATYALPLTGERPDLVQVLGAPEGVLSGFRQEFRLPEGFGEIDTITVLFERSGKAYAAEAPFVNTGDNLGVTAAVPEGGASAETAVPVDSVKLGVDKIEPDGGSVYLEGWAVCLDGVPPAQEAFLELVNETGETVRQPLTFSGERPDIAQAFGLPEATPVAFSARADLPEGFGPVARVDVVFDCEGQFYRAAEPAVI